MKKNGGDKSKVAPSRIFDDRLISYLPHDFIGKSNISLGAEPTDEHDNKRKKKTNNNTSFRGLISNVYRHLPNVSRKNRNKNRIVPIE